MSRFKALYFVIFTLNSVHVFAQISDKRLCGDEECKEPVSYAKSLLRYSSPDARILSFSPNEDVTVFSKSAGNRLDLWGVEVKGKRGYVPKHLIRETKILKKATFLVDTEADTAGEDAKPAQQVPSEKVEPDKVQQAFEVVDGTTFYLNPEDSIAPSSTESPLETTAVPTETRKKDEIKQPEIISSPQTSDKLEIPRSTEQLKEEDVNQAVSDDEDDEDDDEDDYEVEEEDDDEEASEEDQKQQNSNEIPVDNVEADVKPINLEAPLSTEGNVSISEETLEDPKLEVNQTEETKPELEKSNEIIGQTGETTESVVVVEATTPSPVQEPLEQIQETSAEVPLEVPQQTEEIKFEEKLENNEEINETNIDVHTVDSSTEIAENITQADGVPVPSIEVTTFAPEIEMSPQPSDLGDEINVTPDPLESVESPALNEEVGAESVVPTLPPLGLFHSFSGEVPSSGSAEDEQPNVDEDLTSENISESKSNEDLSNENEVMEENATSIEKEVINDLQNEEAPNEVSTNEEVTVEVSEEVDGSPGFFSNIFSFFGGTSASDDVKKDELLIDDVPDVPNLDSADSAPLSTGSDRKEDSSGETLPISEADRSYCNADPVSCQKTQDPEKSDFAMDLLFAFNPDILLYLMTTAISVVIFLFGYIAFDKSKREGPLVAKINKLEKELLIVIKENEILHDKLSGNESTSSEPYVSDVIVDELRDDLQSALLAKSVLEEQIQSLEKELENSTEVGLELNRMLTDILNSQCGSDVLKANVEHLQRQLIEQQATINSSNETLALKDTENHELKLEVDLSNKKVLGLQAELDKMCLNVLKIEEEKDQQQSLLENEVALYKRKFEEVSQKLQNSEGDLGKELAVLRTKLDQAEHDLELKANELALLKDSVKEIKAIKNNSDGVLQKLLNSNEVKAELQTFKNENKKFVEKLQREVDAKNEFEKRAKAAAEEAHRLREKYDEADKIKVETQTKLEVLQNYFKDKEAQLQKEISKHESLWVEKQGEATSTTERIKFMQDQLQSYKAQNESLKQEIMSQEVELKSQILVLEKKVHENWVSARQAERKLEDAKQEAAQLRHRLTLRERTIHEDKGHIRLQSPLDHNGDLPLSPLHVESPASPPLLFGGIRDHMTQSPGLPPFLPPPPGVPFIPPPGVPPFIPPPPTMFPGDHRPPPLGRMSSPPMNSRYSPSSRGYSPYYDDRNSSSPSDSEYGTSPPHRRGYYHSDRRDYKRLPPPASSARSNGRNLSSGSNESLEKVNRSKSKA